MHTKGHPRNSLFGMSWNPANVTLVIMLTLLFLIFLLLFLTLTAQPAMGQTFQVLYTLNRGSDGSEPYASMTRDTAGNLYGTATLGGHTGGNCGSYGCGTVFKLANQGSGWVLTPLYSFLGGKDGSQPYDALTFGADGSLYGTTYAGGEPPQVSGCQQGCGTVFKLTPPSSALGAWTETVLYSFSQFGGYSPYSDVVFDRAGNLYGTTYSGGTDPGCGVVYELIRSGSIWSEKVIHDFTWSGDDGCEPVAGVIFDQAGNLYGVTAGGGVNDLGVVFQLTPSGNLWNYTALHSFNEDGGILPMGGLIFDQQGNLYGTTSIDNVGGAGTVFELSPSGGSWTFTLLYQLPGGDADYGPVDRLAMDASGSLYGTDCDDGTYGDGAVFKLTLSNGSWTYTDLHDFTGGSDGDSPCGGVTLDPSGNLYGTNLSSVIWEITP